MKKKSGKRKRMSPRRAGINSPEAPFSVRWSAKDIKEKLPQRFLTALELVGGDRAPKIRALIRCWTEIVEKLGHDPIISRAAKRVVAEDKKAKKEPTK